MVRPPGSASSSGSPLVLQSIFPWIPQNPICRTDGFAPRSGIKPGYVRDDENEYLGRDNAISTRKEIGFLSVISIINARRSQPLKESSERIDRDFRQVENSTLHPTPIDETPLIIRYRGQEQGTLVIRFIADLFIAEFGDGQ